MTETKGMHSGAARSQEHLLLRDQPVRTRRAGPAAGEPGARHPGRRRHWRSSHRVLDLEKGSTPRQAPLRPGIRPADPHRVERHPGQRQVVDRPQRRLRVRERLPVRGGHCPSGLVLRRRREPQRHQYADDQAVRVLLAERELGPACTCPWGEESSTASSSGPSR